MLNDILSNPDVQEAIKIVKNEFALAIWETIYVTLISTVFATVLGLPLGVLLVAGDKNGVMPLPRGLYNAIGAVINLLRSVPF